MPAYSKGAGKSTGQSSPARGRRDQTTITKLKLRKKLTEKPSSLDLTDVTLVELHLERTTLEEYLHDMWRGAASAQMA